MANSENEPTRPRAEDAGRFDELRDWESELFDQGTWSSPGEASDRDGLPADYKMKHDAHYVDELFSASRPRQVIQVRVADISTPPSEEDWDPSRLADSLSELGVLQPLLVRRNRGRYEVIAGAKRLAAARAAGLREVPCFLYDANDQQAQRLRQATNLRGDGALESADELVKAVFPMLGQSLQTLRTCAESLGPVTGVANTRREKVTGDLIRSEAQRAAFLAWSATVVLFVPRLNLSRFDASDVLEEVIRDCHAEQRLSDLRLDKQIQSRCLLEGDRRLVSLALRGAFDTMLPMARSRQPSTMAVGLARHQPSGSVVLQLSQDALRPAEDVWHRWFDLRWRDRPGGIASGIGLLAAKRVIDVHAGRLAMLPRQGGGCRLAMSFPETPNARPARRDL